RAFALSSTFLRSCFVPRHRVVHDGELGGLEALDLVADAGSGLEVEVGGGVAHLFFERLEMGLEVVADEVAGVGKALAGDAGNVGADVVALVDRVEDVGNLRLHRFRGDAVRLVIGDLLFAAAGRLVHRALHGASDLVGIEDDLAVDVSRRAADGLHQRRLRTQKTFLVGIEDGDEAAFGNVEAFAQQVDADQHVESAEAEVPDDLDALQRVDVRVHVAHANPLLVQVFGEV